MFHFNTLHVVLQNVVEAEVRKKKFAKIDISECRDSKIVCEKNFCVIVVVIFFSPTLSRPIIIKFKLNFKANNFL